MGAHDGSAGSTTDVASQAGGAAPPPETSMPAPPPRTSMATEPGFAERVRMRAVGMYRNATTARLRQPSFTYKSREAARVRRLMRELGVKDPAFEVDGKDDLHAWARSFGVRTPRLLAVHEHVREIDWSALPDRFVLKPTRGASSAGVLLLTRRGGDWLDLVTGRDLTEQGVVTELESLAARKEVSAAVLLEELIEDPRFPGAQPPDYKVSTFFGRIGFIEAKSHGYADGRPVARWRVFGPDWTDLGNGFNDEQDHTIPPPLHAEELLEVAARVSAAIPRPYLRVDMLDSADGPVLGEITPEPGNDPVARSGLDRPLGELWEDAEARLKVRAARAGFLSPAHEPLPEGLVGR
ncbi:teichuronopeptide biosynthesis TupA-like protein [Georgenia soli]|uniref:Teichuronopeptide biosynthesis TupA-like protein n=1 Tax=Georgenia soli TaxID=638953 RepID=A0A2A9EKR5_9MICO|nr:ATP-grasp fold amidoligase family protein [Georgenia soli]PFG38845.1 teichuronopeptide biosynthesis TupA-like protein [Georgenia soli]